MASKKPRKSKTPRKKQASRKKRTRRTIALRVIPEPQSDTRTVIHMVGPGTVVLQGKHSTLVMECGNCGVPLIEGVNMNQVQGIVFHCPSCGEYNETLV